jgi:uncharacterized protein YlxW (UPF0749 family)
MLQATNQKEHTRAFIKFLLLFLGALGLLMLVSFYGTRMPFVERDYLRAKVNNSQGQTKDYEKIMAEVEKLDKKFDEVKTADQWKPSVETEVKTELITLKQLIGEDSTGTNKLFLLLHKNYSTMADRLAETSKLANQNNQLRDKNTTLQEEAKEAKDEIKDLKNQARE